MRDHLPSSVQMVASVFVIVSALSHQLDNVAVKIFDAPAVRDLAPMRRSRAAVLSAVPFAGKGVLIAVPVKPVRPVIWLKPMSSFGKPQEATERRWCAQSGRLGLAESSMLASEKLH